MRKIPDRDTDSGIIKRFKIAGFVIIMLLLAALLIGG